MIGRATARRAIARARVSRGAREVIDARLTYLSLAKIRNLEQCITDVKRRGIEGDLVEAGVALGGSAILMARQVEGGRRFHGYDVFEQIPAPSERDSEDAHRRYDVIAKGMSTGIAGDPYYGYVSDLYRRVVQSFAARGLEVDGDRICLHKGLFESTLDLVEPVALAHIDCDWYNPVQLCLERLGGLLSPGGYLVLDDYHDYGGCAQATHEYLVEHPELRVARADSNLVIRRLDVSRAP